MGEFVRRVHVICSSNKESRTFSVSSGSSKKNIIIWGGSEFLG